MLFTNKPLVAVQREMSFGAMIGFTIGEKGRGRQELFLPAPDFCANEAIRGLRTDITVVASESGHPKVAILDDDDMYLILDSQRGYTRRGNGSICAPYDQRISRVAKANGADGDAGRVGTWDVIIVKANDGDVFRLTWGGYGYGYDATFYVVSDGKVFFADQPDLEGLYESIGLDMPFSLTFDPVKSRSVITPNEWKKI